jgi:integrase
MDSVNKIDGLQTMPNFNPASLSVKGKRKSFPVPGVSSLYLRVSERGTKTWLLKYKIGSTQRKYTIGRYPELSLTVAKKEALRIRGAVSLGHDPQEERREERKALTVKAIAALYIEKHAKPRKRTWRGDEKQLNRDVIPHIGNMTKVTRQDIGKLIDRVVERGSPIASNRLLACLRCMFNWAIREGIIEDNPARMISRRGVEQSRERVLSNEEIRRFWNGLATAKPISDGVRDLLRLALLTGQRIGEVAQMPEVENGIWILRHTKSKRTHRVPLAPMAAEIMSRRRDSFSSHAATRAWGRVRTQLQLGDARVHDLRRTMASNMAALGVDRIVIAKCLNHVSIDRATVTGAVYDRHSYEKEKLAAFTLWEAELLRIVQGADH